MAEDGEKGNGTRTSKASAFQFDSARYQGPKELPNLFDNYFEQAIYDCQFVMALSSGGTVPINHSTNRLVLSQ